MSHFHSNALLGASGNQGYEIERSLRFNDDDSAYLNFTPGSAGNQKTWTWSAWIKRSGSLGSYQHIFNPVNGGDGVNEATLRFDNSDRLQVYDSGTTRGNLVTTQVFRDVSAWYHIVVALDTTQATASNRLKIYVNGQQVTAFATETYPSQDTTWGWNGTQRHDLGRYAYGSSLYFDGYIAETHFVDGTQLAPSNFGETDPVTGAWIPKQYSGSHGSQGWYLDFSDNSGVTATTLGKDSSSNGNNWTPNNFSVTAGTGNDSLEDTPTNNWCTLNPLNRGVDNPTVGNGNLYLSSPSTDHTVVATFGIPSSGKWYWEYSKTAGTNLMSGIIYDPEVVIGSGLSTYLGGQVNGYSVYATNGQKYTGAIGNQTYMATPPTSTTITVAFDADNNELYFGADGNWGDGAGNTDQAFATAAVAYTVPTGKTYYPAISFNGGNAFANFGQRPFDHTPPTGYKALNAANLPVPTVKNGTEYFNTVLWTGNSSTQAITGVGFQPDFVWGKARSVGYAHNLFDAVRGATKSLVSSSTAAEITLSGLTSFDSDGFTLGSNLDLNLTTHTYVAWNWLAGGSSSSNTDGSITSTVSVNADAGFSIVSYTGTGANATVGHGLNEAPEMVIVKDRDRTTDWSCMAQYANNGNGHLGWIRLNLTNAWATTSILWNNTAPTSSVFSIGTYDYVNYSGSDYIAYCFSSVEGYSKIGSYTGNGSTDGTFVFCGFSVQFVLVKRSDSTDSWQIHDISRAPFNPSDKYLLPDSSGAEGTATTVDFLSNGFKLRSSSNLNNSGGSFLFMAFAENPFKYANAR
tara:strand:+ start:4328 stop:6727 length:2400 start_codon:yes stop_codon:yes gene_type:complete